MDMNRKFFVLIAIAVLGLVGCQKDDEYTGNGIRFSVLSGTEGTKTSYGEATTNDDGKRTSQDINWTEGDLVRIYCPQASAPSTLFEDYSVTPLSDKANQGKIEAANNDPLLWSNTAGTLHNFYAVYPSPASMDDGSGFGFSLTSITGDDVNGEGVAAVVTLDFPQEQKPVEIKDEDDSTPTGNYVATPDMRYLYMVAKAKGITEPGIKDQVFLSFFPSATAIEFNIQNAYGSKADMNIVEVFLQTPATGMKLWGTTSTDLAAWNYETAKPLFSTPEETDGGHKASIPFTTTTDAGDAPTAIAWEKTATFTFFLPPYVEAKDLTFGITTKVGDDQFATRTSALSYSTGAPIVFEAFKKHFVKGILVPEGATWIVGGNVVVTDWTETPVDLDFDE